jgi:hypothetical protein
MSDRRLSRKLLLGTAGVATGLLGLAVAFARRPAPADSEITYPPLDMLKPLAEGLWIVDSGPVEPMGLKLPVRMTVVRLGNGDLLLHSPTRYTPELAEALGALGPVRHLVAPTIAHWTFLAEWQLACPGAITWGVPALRNRAQVRRSGVRIDRDLSDAAPPAWADEIEQGLVTGGGGFQEAWFLHQASRTLLLADLIENLEPRKLGRVAALLMRATKATDGTTALHVRTALTLDRERARTAVGKMLATEPERVVLAHGPIFAERAGDRLRRAFAWLV